MFISEKPLIDTFDASTFLKLLTDRNAVTTKIK